MHSKHCFMDRQKICLVPESPAALAPEEGKEDATVDAEKEEEEGVPEKYCKIGRRIE